MSKIGESAGQRLSDFYSPHWCFLRPPAAMKSKAAVDGVGTPVTGDPKKSAHMIARASKSSAKNILLSVASLSGRDDRFSAATRKGECMYLD